MLTTRPFQVFSGMVQVGSTRVVVMMVMMVMMTWSTFGRPSILHVAVLLLSCHFKRFKGGQGQSTIEMTIAVPASLAQQQNHCIQHTKQDKNVQEET